MGRLARGTSGVLATPSPRLCGRAGQIRPRNRRTMSMLTNYSSHDGTSIRLASMTAVRLELLVTLTGACSGQAARLWQPRKRQHARREGKRRGKRTGGDGAACGALVTRRSLEEGSGAIGNDARLNNTNMSARGKASPAPSQGRRCGSRSRHLKACSPRAPCPRYRAQRNRSHGARVGSGLAPQRHVARELLWRPDYIRPRAFRAR